MSTQDPNILELLTRMVEAFTNVGVAYHNYLSAVKLAKEAASVVDQATGEIIIQPHIEIGPNYEMDG